jgi:predicted acylesterase/phospholipase RssA
MKKRGLGVALSGGGHRAALFGLGVLMYLADAGKLRDLTSIASVSGGSMTNGWLAQSGDVTTLPDGRAFERMVQPFVQKLAQRGSLFATPLTVVYVAVLALTGLAVLAVPWFLPIAGFWQFLVFVALLLIWAGFVAGRRAWIAARAFRSALYSPNGTPTLLRDTAGGIDHVFCATDLQSAEQVYFSKTFVYGYRYGLGTPADLPLYDAVQFSACLPGAFPPRWIAADRFAFTYPDDEVHPDDPCPEKRDRPAQRPSHLVLDDGGVYDNMADQWAQGFAGRRRCWPGIDDTHAEPADLVVVNSSAGLEYAPFKRSAIPGVGELLSLLKVKDVLYDQTTATRRRMLRDRSALALREPDRGHMRVGLVNIAQSPFDLPEDFGQPRFTGDASDRARAVLAKLGDTKETWKADADANAYATGTNLSKTGVEVTARLLHHAYVLAMANLHVLLGYDLLDVPPRQRFLDLAAATTEAGDQDESSSRSTTSPVSSEA